ncbi:DinB family protein [Candidatus Enterococcus murrayae]|uniref:DinB family protein n=1 Tax=Candidatus Enterococcus murrayae TaxID=2815321 RepID=A0ABS3HMM0_9ENTE|nr:DinB family protein [Enterococcus sp. MJM16]MBO0454706.1 DinB family protein [Enterococcus sp. MJM16]
MKNTQFAMEMLDRAQERFEDTFAQMTTEEANEMPAPLIKSVIWLMWHTARELDMQISDLNGTEYLWTSAGWSEKFALDLPDDTEDYRHTPEEAAKVIVTDRQLVRDYLSASVEFTKQYLDKIDEGSLADVIDTNWDPPVTRQVRIISAIDDAVMHSGQAVYTRRLVLGK